MFQQSSLQTFFTQKDQQKTTINESSTINREIVSHEVKKFRENTNYLNLSSTTSKVKLELQSSKFNIESLCLEAEHSNYQNQENEDKPTKILKVRSYSAYDTLEKSSSGPKEVQKPKENRFNKGNVKDQNVLVDTEEFEDQDINKDDDEDEEERVTQEKKSKKRGPYKKNLNKKVGKDKFLEDFVKDSETKEFNWLFYDETLDALFCELCLQAKENKHNAWGEEGRGFKSFTKKECIRHEVSISHERAKKFKQAMDSSAQIKEYFMREEQI